MKKTILFLFVIMSFVVNMKAQHLEKQECTIETCFSKCVNHRSICSVWDKTQYLKTYQQVMESNKSRFANLDSLLIGDTVVFPPFESWGRPIGLHNLMIVEKNESIWKMVHRYFAENILFISDEKQQDVANHYYKPPTGTKVLVYGHTMIVF